MNRDVAAWPLRGSQLVEASAGTGKTHTIVSLYLRLLTERKLHPRQIAVVTYTRAAAAELRDRIRARLGEAVAAFDAMFELGKRSEERRLLERALYGFDEAAIHTIHGFCQRVLHETAFECGRLFETEFIDNDRPMIEEIACDYWNRVLHGAPATLLRHVRARALNPGAFTTLATRTVARPNLTVVPQAPRSTDDLRVLEQRWCEARDEFAAGWRADRAGLLRLLCDPGRLNQRSHKKASILKSWLPELDALDRLLPAQVPGCLRHLSTEAMERATKKGQKAPHHELFEAAQRWLEMQARLTERLERDTLALQSALVPYARSELKRRKQQALRQSYDDLPLDLWRALQSESGSTLAASLRTLYPAILVDEFQDTDTVQYDIFRWIHGQDRQAALFLIGDPKQAVYGFRGADVHAYLRATSTLGKNRHALHTNWRSDPRLLQALEVLFARVPQPFLFPDIAFRSVAAAAGARERLSGQAAGGLELLLLPGPERSRKAACTGAAPAGPGAVFDLVAGEVAFLLASKTEVDAEPIAPRHIAILCRTNAQARQTQQALARCGIPAVHHGDDSVFDSGMAEELERTLRAWVDPSDRRALCAALATSIFGVDGPGLRDLQQDDIAWDRHMAGFWAWHRIWHEQGFVQAFNKMLDTQEVYRRLLALPDGERQLTNLLHLGELLQDAAVTRHLGPRCLLQWLAQARHDAAARATLVADSAQIRLESDSRAVTLTTIHKSKGLEYPIVYCPFLWDGTLLRRSDRYPVLFHDREQDDRALLDLRQAKDSPHRTEAETEAFAENLRLLYVALTRARHRCSVVWGRFRGIETSALGYLLHHPVRKAPLERPSAGKQRAATAARAPFEHSRPAAGTRELLETAREHIRGLDEAAWMSDLQSLCETSGGSIAVRTLGHRPMQPYRAARAASAGRARQAKRRYHDGWRMTSFSQLTSARPLPQPLLEGLDHDGQQTEAASHMAPPSAPQLLPAQRQPGEAGRARIALAELPAGAHTGQALHEILEELDFQQPGHASELIEATLARHGLASAWSDSVRRALTAALRTDLGGGSELRLCDLPMTARLNEMQFVFPVPRAIGAATLAGLFERNHAPPAVPDYHLALAQLGFDRFRGFLKGYIDLVFRHGERYYLLDYKSNLLGEDAKHYKPARLAAAMGRQHYVLQYHLYVVALHRHLAQRMRGYDYEHHFGGVYYLFLRGMHPEHPAGTGVYYDRPSAELVSQLDATLAGREAQCPSHNSWSKP
ncbi:MAG: exodeoxyribonuclease V subunit beta [Proteobacteria bacterium]|nr:exodeoxyribonuclease V subunit beta [Pseudomonadota bacterium]